MSLSPKRQKRTSEEMKEIPLTDNEDEAKLTDSNNELQRKVNALVSQMRENSDSIAVLRRLAMAEREKEKRVTDAAIRIKRAELLTPFLEGCMIIIEKRVLDVMSFIDDAIARHVCQISLDEAPTTLEWNWIKKQYGPEVKMTSEFDTIGDHYVHFTYL